MSDTPDLEPMYSHDYILEKFTQALCDLATGEGDARSRIATAYDRFSHVKEECFPAQFRIKRTEIDRLLTKPGGREGYMIPDNLKKMKNKTATKIAKLILEIYFDLARDHNAKFKS